MSDELDQMIRRHRDDLGRAQRRRAARRGFPVRRVAIAGAIAGLALGVGVAVLPGSDPTTATAYAVERALEKLSPGEGILHYRLRESLSPLPGGPARGPVEIRERWQTTSPPRYRERLTAEGGGRTLVAELALAGGYRFSWQTGDEHVLQELAPESIEPGNEVLSPDDDPVTQARQLLEEGDIEDGGELRLDGRLVRKLVGKRTIPMSPVMSESLVRSEYLVDAETFEPIEIRVKVTSDGRTSAPTVSRFELFERLPLTPENERLLEVQAPPGVTTVKRD